MRKCLLLMSQPYYLNNLHMMSLRDELKVHRISLLHYLKIIKVNHKADTPGAELCTRLVSSSAPQLTESRNAPLQVGRVCVNHLRRRLRSLGNLMRAKEEESPPQVISGRRLRSSRGVAELGVGLGANLFGFILAPVYFRPVVVTHQSLF